jgi:hypothetical protein
LTAAINRLRVRIFDKELRDLVRQYTSELIAALNPAQANGLMRQDGDDGLIRMAAERMQSISIQTRACPRREPWGEDPGAVPWQRCHRGARPGAAAQPAGTAA